ncbi:hypothetical protein S83_020451 [Arachis hypogaea]
MEEPHIAVVPSAGFTHLVPILEFSKRLLSLHPRFQVTCLIPSVGSSLSTSSQSYLQTLPPTIHPILLPPVSKEHVQAEQSLAVQIELSVTHSLPHIKQELSSLCSRARVVALLVDVFAHDALQFATEFNLLSYIYLPQAALILSWYLYSQELDEILFSENRDPEESIEIPGFVPMHSRDLPFQSRSSPGYRKFLERAEKFQLPDGVFVNSFHEMEASTINALRDEIRQKKRKTMVYPVGPITQSGFNGRENGSECLNWLDEQEPESVLYVSFGSGGTLSQDQLNELAFGLEQSGKKFLWVLRPPNDIASASYLGGEAEDPMQFLPRGFLERTSKKQGLVVPLWAPQVQILGHGSTGGFVCHCGWNSVLESVINGVPVIAWPLFAEQSMNAVILSDALKVAVRPKANDSGLVEREEIARVARELMDGKEGIEIRKRMKSLSIAAENAIKEDGPSTKTLAEVVATWK